MRARAAILLLITAGCAAPDRWEELRPDFAAAAGPSEPSAAASPLAGPLELSVERVVMLALERNRDLRTESFRPVVAGTFQAIERGVFDPELFAELEYFEERATEISRSTGDQFGVDAKESRAEVGVRQRFPSGTDLEASVRHARDVSNRTPEQQDARIGLTVTQSLLRGFGPAVNLARVRQAEIGEEASLEELRGFVEALLAETEIAYWDFVLANQQISIFEESLAVAKKQRDEVEERIQVGILPETEAAAARAEVARREQALIDARSRREERRLRLLRRIGAVAGSPDVVATTEPGVDPEPVDDVADRVELAVLSRPEIREAKLRLEQDRLETIVTKDGVLPRLDFFVALGRTGYADTLGGAFRGVTDDTWDAAAGLSLRWTLGNRSALARDRAAVVKRRIANRAIAGLEELVRLDVRLAANELERARQQIAASASTRALEEQTVRAEKERFDVGTGTAILVAQAQRDLLASRIAEVEAVVAWRIALVRLHLAEGSLLDRRGVVVGN